MRENGLFFIFDVGSNATKASLVRDARPPVIEKNWRIETGLTRYIETVDGTKQLGTAGMRVLVDAFNTVCREIDGHESIAKYGIGTEALRRIDNAGAVVETVRRECGVELEVISAEMEAQLERRAVRQTECYRRNRDKCILCLDSGGSSTEFNFLIPNGEQPAKSYPFGQHDIKNAIMNGASMPFSSMFEELKSLVLKYRPELVIVAGSSFTSYARYALKLERYSDAGVEGKAIEAGVSVPPGDLKAECGSRLVTAVKNVANVPVYATTHGIRHGWIDLRTCGDG